MKNKYPLIFIVGPTASGKTEAAVELADRISAQIISCDSMLVYREPEILVNKPPKKILERVKHHLVGLVSVEEEFDVYRFKKEADRIVNRQYGRKNLIFSGGSGLYVKVLLDGIFDQAGSSQDLRERFKREAEEKGVGFLYRKLRKVDPEATAKIDPGDLRRIIRALEVYSLTSQPISLYQKQAKGYFSEFKVRVFGLRLERKRLYARIDRRAEEMFEQGAVEEVEALNRYRLSQTARKILGVPEINSYLNAKLTKVQALSELKKNTRHFAKRQLTWFNKDKRILWIDADKKSPSEITSRIIEELKT